MPQKVLSPRRKLGSATYGPYGADQKILYIDATSHLLLERDVLRMSLHTGDDHWGQPRIIFDVSTTRGDSHLRAERKIDHAPHNADITRILYLFVHAAEVYFAYYTCILQSCDFRVGAAFTKVAETL